MTDPQSIPVRGEQHEPYEVGTRLVHHSGELWEVAAANLPGDGQWHGTMIEEAGDYLIVCLDGRSSTTGTQRRVHADYLHGGVWRSA